MPVRALPYIVAGLLVDGFQIIAGVTFFILGLTLQGITPVGGGITGATTGAYLCWSMSGSVLEGVADAAACGIAGGIGGGALSAFGLPTGAALGAVSSVFITLVFGTGFIFLLFLGGMFYPSIVFTTLIGEAIPGIGILPFWTVLAVRSAIQKSKEEESGDTITVGTEEQGGGSNNSQPQLTGYPNAPQATPQVQSVPQAISQDVRPPTQTTKPRHEPLVA